MAATVTVVILAYYRIREETLWKDAGSRFTGEDAVWILENSNIRIEKKNEIHGPSTPFREYIRSSCQCGDQYVAPSGE
jgi:hypothetical protein